MFRPTFARIDLAAIRHNYRLARQLAPARKAVAVIKANGYGHGAVKLAQALSSEADAFAVACLEEALELRTAGIQNPIILIEGFFSASELPVLVEQQFMPVLHNIEQVRVLEQATLTQPLTVWLKMDSGMHRLGFAPEEYATIHARLQNCPQVEAVNMMTHLACADELDNAYTEQQLATFQQASAGLNGARSIANSAGILAWPASHGDWVRAGIMLYGCSPLDRDTPESLQLIPAMQLQAQIIAVREVQTGELIGYGGTFKCPRPTRVGVVSIGYADGYPRHAPSGTPVAVDGQRTCLIGRVSMDMITVDLTDLPQTGIGSHVELWGRQVLAKEVADACGTIAYELFSHIARRVPLQYVGSEVNG